MACLAAAPAVVAAGALVTGVTLRPRGAVRVGMSDGKALHLGVHGRPLGGAETSSSSSQQARLWGVPTAPSYIAGSIMMAQATEGDRYGKALPLTLTPGRGSF